MRPEWIVLILIALAVFFGFIALVRPTTSNPPVGFIIEPGQQHSNFTKDDWERVALDYVYGKAPRTDDSFWGGTVEQCDRAIARINELRAEYQSIEPARLRKEIMHWLDFYENRAKEDRADVISQKHRKSADDYDRKRREEDARANALRETLRVSEGARHAP